MIVYHLSKQLESITTFTVRWIHHHMRMLKSLPVFADAQGKKIVYKSWRGNETKKFQNLVMLNLHTSNLNFEWGHYVNYWNCLMPYKLLGKRLLMFYILEWLNFAIKENASYYQYLHKYTAIELLSSSTLIPWHFPICIDLSYGTSRYNFGYRTTQGE